MKTKLTSIACCAFIAVALAATPSLSRAADSTNAPAAQTPTPKKHGLPYRGKVAAVDANAMTFTVGATTYAITSATKITKEGKPAIFSDITVGAAVHGSYVKDDAGKANATLVRIGATKKPEASAPAATNAPAAAPQ
jgi:hypothetical protein